MTIFKHELRQGRISLLIWASAISFMVAICILVFPDMSAQMGGVLNLFANMGSFTKAFGLDVLNFGEFMGFFGIECGNILGLGGAFFAALLGITALAKEEGEHTADFLLTHPIARWRVVAEKLWSVVFQIAIVNLAVIAVTLAFAWIIGEKPEYRTLALLFLGYFLMQLEIGAITFCISAFLNRGGMGVGLGLAAVFYFLNIIANLVNKTKFLKYITPFGYADSSEIISNHAMNPRYLTVGMGVTVLAIFLAFWRYGRKDIV